MDIRTREAVRYLGYGRNAVDDRTLAEIESSFQELEMAAGAKSIYRIFELKMTEPEILEIGNMKIKSKNLAKNMRGCEQAVMFGATLGTGVDLLMKRYSVTDMAKAVILQACAAAMLEEYCDALQESIAEELEKEELYLRPRFSPGYGDFSIRHQEDILKMLDSAKRIGLAMTDSYMLTPVKSVTAVIGVSNTKEPCHIKGCEECKKTDCVYRRS